MSAQDTRPLTVAQVLFAASVVAAFCLSSSKIPRFRTVRLASSRLAPGVEVLSI